MKMLSGIVTAFLLSAAAGHAAAQSVVPSTLNAAGGTAAINGNTYDWSVGEMAMISTNAAGSIVVTHGVLQPSGVTTGISNEQWLADNLSIYPNPANEVVYIAPAVQAGSVLHYLLMDVAGKLVQQKEMVLHQGTERQQLQTGTLTAGTYLLQVRISLPGGSSNTGNYKIQKLD